MTDVSTGEMSAELDAVPPQAASVDGLAPATDESAAAPTLDDTSSEVPSGDARTLPEIEYPIGPLRQAVLDALLDADEPLSVARIHAEMPVGTSKGSAESAIKREFDACRIERVAPGVYRLAPARPAEPPEPAEADPVHNEHTDEQWFAWLDAWQSGGKWEGPGNPPNQSGCLVPSDIKLRFNDRLRKRAARRQEAEAAAAKRTAADAELRNRLLAACNGNFSPGAGLDDLSPIKLALELVPLDHVLFAIRAKIDKRCFPGNAPLTSWSEQRLLREIAESYCRDIVPNLVAAWSKAGQAPAPKTQSSPAGGEMPDDTDDLRRLHDSPSAPPGPHSLPGDVPMPAPANAADTSEAPAAVSAPLEQGSAPVSSPPQPVAMPEDRPAIDAEPAAVDAKPPAEPTRASIMAAFNRPRQPQPAPPQHQPAQRQAERPWFAGERQAAPEPEMSDEGWEELIAGFVAGNVVWNTRRLGPEPGNHGCRAPQSVLRRYRL
jgi:hypothetical protein